MGIDSAVSALIIIASKTITRNLVCGRVPRIAAPSGNSGQARSKSRVVARRTGRVLLTTLQQLSATLWSKKTVMRRTLTCLHLCFQYGASVMKTRSRRPKSRPTHTSTVFHVLFSSVEKVKSISFSVSVLYALLIASFFSEARILIELCCLFAEILSRLIQVCRRDNWTRTSIWIEFCLAVRLGHQTSMQLATNRTTWEDVPTPILPCLYITTS
jgi:hypothetical protein